MIAPARLYSLGLSASPPDASAGRVCDTRRSAPSPVRAGLGGLRRAAAALLLGLPLLFGLAAGAQAQTAKTLEFLGFRTGGTGNLGSFDGTYEVDEGKLLLGKIKMNEFPNVLAGVGIRVKGGTATAGQDYGWAPYGWRVTVHKDSGGYGWFWFRIADDAVADDVETIELEFFDVQTAPGYYNPDGTIATTNHGTATITIRDYTSTDPADYSVKELIWLTKGEYNVTEGGAVRGEVRISNPRGVDTTISLTESVGTASHADYTAGPYSVTIPAGRTSAEFWLHTKQDTGLESQEAFTVRLSAPSERAVSVDYHTRETTPVSAREDGDYLGTGWHLTLSPGETEKRFWVYIYNDSHDEDAETFEVVLSDPTGGAAIADGVAVGTIVNSDPMPAAWLARFGRTVAEQALDGISGRMAAPRTAGAQGTIAGQALSFGTGGPDGSAGAANDNAALGSVGLTDSGSLAQSDIARAFGASGNAGFGHDALGFGTGGTQPRSQSMTGLEALLGSSFTATGEKDGAGGSMAFWGRAAQSRFDGREGTFSLDGDTTTAMLGADYARGRWMVGMALMQSSGKGGYADSGTPQACPEDADPEYLCAGAVQEGDGKVEASLTAAVPYAAIQASERLKLWGALGYGTGEVTLKPEMGASLKSDISWTMASAGLRGDLLPPPKEGSGPALALTSDALWARTSSEKTSELAASDSDVTRLRLGLEGSWKVALEDGGHLTPKLEIGARHDGGDAETGFGVELGGGLAWVDPRLGLSLDLSGRTLVAHGSDDLEDRGFAASLAFDPNPASARGPSLTLRQDWGGRANGGLDALFTPETLDRRTGGGAATSRWQAEAAYGFPAFSGRFTGSPHVGLGLATGARDYSLGWRLTPAANANAPDVSFGLKATRRENDTAAPEHTVGFEVNARW